MSMLMRAAKQMDLTVEAGALLHDGMTPQEAVDVLLQDDRAEEALKLLARLLPKRYAVAWVCQCARGEKLSMEDKAGAALAENWVREPIEAHRRAAYEFADAGDYESLGAWIAVAAGWADGSLAPAQQEAPVPPEEHLTACACVAAINLLAALDAEQFAERRDQFIHKAMELLARGGLGGTNSSPS